VPQTLGLEVYRAQQHASNDNDVCKCIGGILYRFNILYALVGNMWWKRPKGLVTGDSAHHNITSLSRTPSPWLAGTHAAQIAMADAIAIAAVIISALAIVATVVLAIVTRTSQKHDSARIEALAARVRQEEQQESLAVRQEQRLQALEVRYAEIAAPAMAQVMIPSATQAMRCCYICWHAASDQWAFY
jgi:hypothetical protein